MSISSVPRTCPYRMTAHPPTSKKSTSASHNSISRSENQGASYSSFPQHLKVSPGHWARHGDGTSPRSAECHPIKRVAASSRSSAARIANSGGIFQAETQLLTDRDFANESSSTGAEVLHQSRPNPTLRPPRQRLIRSLLHVFLESLQSRASEHGSPLFRRLHREQSGGTQVLASLRCPLSVKRPRSESQIFDQVPFDCSRVLRIRRA
jgi:hypothetical protein